MRAFFDNLRLAFGTFAANPLRTLLTLLGIVIGVTTVMTMMALLEGLSTKVNKDLSQLGANVFRVGLHGDVDPGEKLANIINEAVKRKGPILIPAFAVGRTQEILYLLRELEEAHRIPVLPVVVDSPMASQATQVYNRFPEEHDEEYTSILMAKKHPLRTGSMQTASSRDESKRIDQMRGPRIIVSASGMMTGGACFITQCGSCRIRMPRLSLSDFRPLARSDDVFRKVSLMSE